MNTLPIHVYNQMQFIGSLAHTITKEEKEMALLGMMGCPVLVAVDVTMFIEA